MKETPILLLTGYLGSGKTTLLNRILTNRRGIRFAVVVNDIGEVNIDAELIARGGIASQRDESLVALQNGCICCTLKLDLVEQIHELMAQQRFDYIVIEASGVCEPAPIAQTICSIPTMSAKYTAFGLPRLDSIVTVVDALRMRDEFGCGQRLTRRGLDEDDIENLIIQQVEFCNIVLLNKADEVSAEERARIHQIIRTLQPEARIIECNYCDVDLNMLLDTGLFQFDRVATSAGWIHEIEKEMVEPEPHHHEHHHHDHDDDDDHDHHHEHGHHHHHHHDGEGEADEYGIGTYVYYRRRPLNINRFDMFVGSQFMRRIIRTKGICWFSHAPEMSFMFEQAGSQLTLREAGQWYATMPTDELAEVLEAEPYLKRDWDPVVGDRMQKIVFIGQNLDREEIDRQLDACLE